MQESHELKAGGVQRRGAQIRRLLLSVLISGSGLQTVRCETFSFQQGVDGYAGTEDSYLRSAQSSGNFGSATILDLAAGSDPRNILIRFDDIIGSAVNQLPAGSSIVSATLWLRSGAAGGGSQGAVHRGLTDWSQDSVTWGNFGSTPGGAAGQDFASVPSGNLSTVTGGGVSVEVTEDVRAWMDGEANLGWYVIGASSSVVQCAASEFQSVGYRPRLLIEAESGGSGSGPQTADYFPMAMGSSWLYEARTSGLTTDVEQEIDEWEYAGGRRSFGHFYYLPIPDYKNARPQFGEILAGDPGPAKWPDPNPRGRDHRSLGTAGVFLDKTWVHPGSPYADYTVDWNSMNIIGPTLEAGATKTLNQSMNIYLADYEWRGTTTGTVTVVGRESVTVPAGTFDAYKIQNDISFSGTILDPAPEVPSVVSGGDGSTMWVAEGIGMVKQIAVRTGSFGSSTVYYDLLSHALQPSRYSISGHVLNVADDSGMAGVTVDLMQDGGVVATTQTSSSGWYRFAEMLVGDYTVSPLLAGHEFDRASEELSLKYECAVDPFLAEIVAMPDLASPEPGEISPATVVVGDEITISGTIENWGGASAGEFAVEFALSSDLVPGTGHILGSRSYASIAASGARSFSETFATPDDLPAGTYFGFWVIDPQASVDEENESNNDQRTAAGTVVSPPAVIQIASPNGGGCYATGSLIPILWTSSGSVGSEIGIELWKGGAALLTIASSTPNDGGFEWTIPASVPVGTDYTIVVSSVLDTELHDQTDAGFSISLNGNPGGAIDSDGDGMPDAWEDANGLLRTDPADALVDSDGDGYLDIDEFRTGCDPRDAQSWFRPEITSVVGLGGDELRLEWRCAPGYVFWIERSERTEGPWVEVAGTRRIAAGFESSHSLPIVAGGVEFFRVSATVPDPSLPGVVSGPQPQTVIEGSIARMTSLVREASFVSFRWERKVSGSSDWLPLTEVSGYAGWQSPALVIPSVRTSMSGDEFRCVATNAAGSLVSAAAALTVVPRPVLRSGLTANGFRVEWDSVDGYQYHLSVSTDGVAWLGAGLPVFAGSGGVLWHEDTWESGVRPPMKLYRIEMSERPEL